MDDKKILLTAAGVKKIEKELEERKVISRKTIADDIDKARQLGDLSENSAYKSALEQKEFNEKKISELENTLNHAEIIDNTDSSVVAIGNQVELQNIADSQKVEYFVVGDNEASPTERKISINSPIGSALAGAKKGDMVKVILPIGEIVYKIINIL